MIMSRICSLPSLSCGDRLVSVPTCGLNHALELEYYQSKEAHIRVGRRIRSAREYVLEFMLVISQGSLLTELPIVFSMSAISAWSMTETQ